MNKNKKSLLHDHKHLCIPTLKWLGLKLDELSIFPLQRGEQYLMDLTTRDIRIAQGLMKKLAKANEFDLIKQVKLMIFDQSHTLTDNLNQN